MNETLFLIGIFFAVLLFVLTLSRIVSNRREVSRNVAAARRGRRKTNEDIERLLGTGNEQIRYYLDTVQNAPLNSLRMRLVQAGYFDKSALFWFNVIRLVATAGLFLAVQFGLPQISPSTSTPAALLFATVAAAAGFIGCSWFLERQGKKRMIEFRKIFPDFMDLLLVCVDAGLSIDASIDRVTREFLKTVEDFGVQLSIVSLEVRAGRPMHEALHNLSERIRVEEARMLAVLFRQSEELGASVSQTLRTFAAEMRQLRLIRAEEKANTLPLKMLFPMALFMFPVNLIIVLVPVMLSLLKMFLALAPGAT
ncbi:type II secretion system F family protein [Litorisediminicola beolgyonensis]|uniref:Type II secretion system F family protein n=1 Tax=Litorisediminicola beolgyonensis TaxID=1173614 RepID=A0ABW3ZEM2_9RHOB